MLRFDRELMPPVTPTEVAVSFGVSAWLGESFGGHWWMAIVSCALYALLYVEAFWTEVGMQMERYAKYPLRATPIVFVLIFASTFIALKLCHRRTLRGANYSLMPSLCLLLASGLAAYALSWVLLPNLSINGPGKPQEAYFRNTSAFLAAGCFCLLVPYHFVLTMQRELSEGKHAMALRFLSGQKDAILPRKAVYLNLRLVFVFLVIVGLSIWWANDLYFNTLPAGRNRTVLVALVIFLWFHYHALAAGWLFWYSRMLNELKRECLIADAFRTK